MFTRRIAGFLTVLLALFGSVTTASAQFRRVVPDDMVKNSLYSGDRVRFCVNSVSSLANFDMALGQRLADMLLVPVEFYQLIYAVKPAAWGYELTLGEEDLFIQMSANCDALLGYPMPVMDQTYGWLTVTSPYYTPRFMLALAKDAPDSLVQLPEGATVGSKIGILADMHVRAYVKSSANQLKRRVYPSHVSMINDLSSGTLPAAIIWAPAVAVAAQSEPDAASIRIVEPPFAIDPLELAIALPSNQTYLREMLNSAIVALRSGGEFEALLDEFGLPGD